MAAVSLSVLGLLLAPAMAACMEPVAVILSARGTVSAGPAFLEAPSPAPNRQLMRSERVPGEAPAHGGPELGGAVLLVDRGRQPILVHEGSPGPRRPRAKKSSPRKPRATKSRAQKSSPRRRRAPKPAQAPQPGKAGAQAHRGSGTQALDRDMVMGEVWNDREQVDILSLINGTSKLGMDLQELERIEERKIKDYKSFGAVVGAQTEGAAMATGAHAPLGGPTAAAYEAAEKVDRDVKLEEVRELQVYHDVGAMNDVAKAYEKDAVKALEAATKVGERLRA